MRLGPLKRLECIEQSMAGWDHGSKTIYVVRYIRIIMRVACLYSPDKTVKPCYSAHSEFLIFLDG